MSRDGVKYEHNKDIRFSFFPGKRRKVVLEKMTANEKDNNPNLIFGFRMPITGEPMIGLPEFIQSAYEAVNKEDSLVAEAGLRDFELAGMTLEFFHNQPDGSKRMIMMTNKSLFKFSIEREKDGDSFITIMRFKVRVEETRARLLFWHDKRGVTIWADFTPTADATREADDNQMSFEDQAAKAREDSDEGDDEREETEMPQQTPERARAVKGGVN
jgi:hypothetical protein